MLATSTSRCLLRAFNVFLGRNELHKLAEWRINESLFDHSVNILYGGQWQNSAIFFYRLKQEYFISDCSHIELKCGILLLLTFPTCLWNYICKWPSIYFCLHLKERYFHSLRWSARCWLLIRLQRIYFKSYLSRSNTLRKENGSGEGGYVDVCLIDQWRLGGCLKLQL